MDLNFYMTIEFHMVSLLMLSYNKLLFNSGMLNLQPAGRTGYQDHIFVIPLYLQNFYEMWFILEIKLKNVKY